MARTTIERIDNIHGHYYMREGNIHICKYCGTAEHNNGKFWWAGRCSKSEPPCADDVDGQHTWFVSAISEEA